MNRLYLIICLLPVWLFSCAHKPNSKDGLVKIYTRAIGDFVTVARAKNKPAFDTLYIGKRANGLPDDFSDIELPAKIGSTVIKLVAPEAYQQLPEQKTRTYLNLVGWVDEKKAEFIFVVFFDGFKHQYDCTLTYTINGNNVQLTEVNFKEPPF